MACKCTDCPCCHGSGIVWYSFSGDFLGTRRCDDFDEWESCDECGGSGIDQQCEDCYYEWFEEQECQPTKNLA